MLPLPQPDDLASLILRTDFTNDSAWAELQAAIGTDEATYVSDARYSGVTVQALVDADAAADDDDKLTYLFVADAVTMTVADHPLLVVDLFDEPGRSFRVAPRWYVDVSANLCIANMDFRDFADATDGSDYFRGFRGERDGDLPPPRRP